MVLRLRGYGTWIESNGKPLDEYAVEVEGNIISCYVCSEEGKEFSLHFDDDGSDSRQYDFVPDSYGRVVKVKVDGTEVDRMWGESLGKRTSWGMRMGDIVRPYVFALIETTDDDRIASRDDPINKLIGTIEVELKRAILLGSGGNKYRRTGPRTGPVHERSKKAGSHRIAFGTCVHKEQNTVDVDYLDDTPWLVFRFLYRKRDLLEAHGILPRSPRPSPLPVEPPGPFVKVGRKRGKRIRQEMENTDFEAIIGVAFDEDDLGTIQDEFERTQDRVSRKKSKTVSVKLELTW